jgi:sarcosine oxidase
LEEELVMKVAVVGAGVMGSATADALRRRGHETVLFEQFEPGHARGSSHGRSRIVRRAYPDAYYTEIMQEAYPLWYDLAARSEEPLLFETGLLYFGPKENENIRTMTDGLASLNVPFELVEDLSPRFPRFVFQLGEVGVFTPEAGWVHADRVTSTLRRDISVRRGRVSNPEALLGEFDFVLLLPGGWIRQFVPELAVQPQRMTFAYLRTPKPDFLTPGPLPTSGQGVENDPVWIEESPHMLYGFPPETGTDLVKVGVHAPGIPLDPNEDGRTPLPEALEILREFAARRFGLPDAELVEPTACIYTWRDDQEFRWGKLHEKVAWASPCSGHGFKFALWIGERMADFADGTADPADWPRFLMP